MPQFVTGTVPVRVPATSANLGSGYDTLALALSWYDDVAACVIDSGLRIDVTGEGADLARDEHHLVVRAMRAGFDRIGAQPPGLQLHCTNRIPHGRGLGSSAAAIVAGVLLARALVVDGTAALPDPEAFALAAQLEGHPDNVAACFYGGLTIAWTESGRARAVRAATAAEVVPVVLVPPFESATAAARGVLPASVPHADAAFAAARSALLVALLGGADAEPDALLAATADRLHQGYRAPAMPATGTLVARLRAEGLAAVVSGAGPTVLVLARDHLEVEQVRAAAPADWRCAVLELDSAGARVSPVPAQGDPGPGSDRE
jgi:homoserine kinase